MASVAKIPHFSGGDPPVTANLNRLVDAINGLLDARGTGPIMARQSGRGDLSFALATDQLQPQIPRRKVGVCKITSNEGGGEYKITELIWNPDTPAYEAVTAGIVEALAREYANFAEGIVNTDPHPFWTQANSKGETEYLVGLGVAIGDGCLVVKVTKTSGDAGSTTTQCAFLYTATTIDGVTTLGTGLTPEKPRPTIGKMVAPAAGSYGLGFYDENGAFCLWDAGEVFDLTAVSPLTDYQWNTSTHKYELKTTKIAAIGPDAESAWVLITNSTECDDTG